MALTNLEIHDIPATTAKPLVPESLSEGPILLTASLLKCESVDWLWNGWLAKRKLHLLAGSPGNGKTTIALNIAATISHGGTWPDGDRAPKGRVVVWSGEDGLEDTLGPRLIAAGADLENVSFITSFRENGEIRAFDPSADMGSLRAKLAQISNLKLLILDPIVSAVQGDSHKNAEVRKGLQPLVDLAIQNNCAVLGITHFSKGTGGRNPVERLTGSLAFGAVARIVWVAAKGDATEDSEERVFCRAKSNIGPDSGGFKYQLKHARVYGIESLEASVIAWGEPMQGSARDLLATTETDFEEGSALSEAKGFLVGLLSDGPLPVKAVQKESNEAGHTWATIRRAATALGVQSEKVRGSMTGRWEWCLPRTCSSSSEDAQPF
jgi:putative DNA primase/helicase